MPAWPTCSITPRVVDDGIIVGKNGAFLAAWVYQGDDQASSTDEEGKLVSFRINQALSSLGSGWMIHVDAVRRPAPNYPLGPVPFSVPVCEAIDEERRRLFEGLGTMYEGYFVLSVTYFPPLLAQRKFVELMFEDDGHCPTIPPAPTADRLSSANAPQSNPACRRRSGCRGLRGEKGSPEDGKVTHDGLLRWLQYCVTGITTRCRCLEIPSTWMRSRRQELYGGVVPEDRPQVHRLVVAIEGFPLESAPGMLDRPA